MATRSLPANRNAPGVESAAAAPIVAAAGGDEHLARASGRWRTAWST